MARLCPGKLTRSARASIQQAGSWVISALWAATLRLNKRFGPKRSRLGFLLPCRARSPSCSSRCSASMLSSALLRRAASGRLGDRASAAVELRQAPVAALLLERRLLLEMRRRPAATAWPRPSTGRRRGAAQAMQAQEMPLQRRDHRLARSRRRRRCGRTPARHRRPAPEAAASTMRSSAISAASPTAASTSASSISALAAREQRELLHLRARQRAVGAEAGRSAASWPPA